MSVQAITWAIGQEISVPAQKLLLICLANYADKEGVCWPGQKALAEDTCMTDRSVRTHIKALEAAGYLTREERRRQDKTRTSDKYCLNIKRKILPVDTGPTGKSASDLPENPRQPHRKIFPGNEPVREPSEEPGTQAPRKPERFEEAWSAYPEGQGRNCGKPEACRAYLGQVRDGADEADLIAGVKAYARSAKPDYTMRFDRFMRDEVWREHVPRRVSASDDREAWRIKLDMWARNGRWPASWGGEPGTPGCKAPPDLIKAAQERAA